MGAEAAVGERHRPHTSPPPQVDTSSVVDRLLGKLARQTSSGRYIPEIDGLRFVAIVSVFLVHVAMMRGFLDGSWAVIRPFGLQAVGPSKSDLLTRGAAQGWYGVELFFVLSGFVLALPFIGWRVNGGPKVSLQHYFLRRLTRIEPPYLVAMTLLFIGAAIAGENAGWAHYLASTGYVHGLVFRGPSTIDTVAWSLEVEIQFYICVPLLAVLFSLRETWVRRATIVLVAMLGVVCDAHGFLGHYVAGGFLWNYLQFFLVGWLLADLYVVSWSSKPELDRRWDLVSLVGWPLLIAGLMASDRFRFGAVAGPWILLALCTAALRGPATGKLLRNRWITTIGGMCYSIYLLHYPILFLLTGWTRRWRVGSLGLDLILRTVILGSIVLIVSAIFFALVEKPCMDPRWPARFAAWVRGARRQPSPDLIVIPDAE